MTITPDTKDWTWVLERTCPECGFDVRTFPREQVGQMIRDNVRQWQDLLRRPEIRRRPTDDVWSGLEYACHVRDVYALYDTRLRLMLEQENPQYPNWDQDETAVSSRYHEQDPATVAEEIAQTGAALADRFDALEKKDWLRTGTRSDGAHFTVESFARYLIHDPIHHVHDVEQGLASG